MLAPPEEEGLLGRLTPRKAFSPTMWGLNGSLSYWGAVLELFDEDKVEGAYDLAIRLGEGNAGQGLSVFRLIEAEHVLRAHGQIRQVDESLSVEYLDHELAEEIDRICYTLAAGASGLRQRFGIEQSPPVRVALLSGQTDAWWATSRFGYCTQKVSFFKIGIPFHATEPSRLPRVFLHEYAHVLSLTLTKGRLTSWLGEGFSVYASEESTLRAQHIFSDNRRLWLDPRALDRQYSPRLDLADPAKWLAYQQAGIIVAYLAGKGGDKSLTRLLERHGDESFWLNLRMQLWGGRTDEAMRTVFGMAEKSAFLAARP